MKRPYSFLLLIFLLTGLLAFCQEPTAEPKKELDPQMKQPTEPPRTQADPNARRGEDSSSADRTVDISPPPDDDKHPRSSLVGPDPTDGVTEMKQWNPHQADKEVEVGLYYFRRKNYGAAERRFRTALYWQDNHAEACYRLGTALEKLKQPEEAREYYERYLKILPKGEFANDARKALDRLKPAAPAAQAKATSQPG